MSLFSYIKKTWRDNPVGATPIQADDLNKFETAFENINNAFPVVTDKITAKAVTSEKLSDDLNNAIATNLSLAQNNFLNLLKTCVYGASASINGVNLWSELFLNSSRINAGASANYTVNSGNLTSTVTTISRMPASGATAVSGTRDWTNPNYINSDNSSSATTSSAGAEAYSYYLKASNFGFSLPSDAIIKGISVAINRWGSEYAITYDSEVRLIGADGNLRATNKANGNAWPYNSGTVVGYGGSSDVWSDSLGYSDINSSNFGVALKVRLVPYGGGEDPLFDAFANVDYIQVSVTYQRPMTVIFNAVTSSKALAKIALVAEQTLNSGAITWYVSKNGSDWVQIASLDVLQNVNFDATSVYIKCVITNDAVVSGVAWGGY